MRSGNPADRRSGKFVCALRSSLGHPPSLGASTPEMDSSKAVTAIAREAFITGLRGWNERAAF